LRQSCQSHLGSATNGGLIASPTENRLRFQGSGGGDEQIRLSGKRTDRSLEYPVRWRIADCSTRNRKELMVFNDLEETFAGFDAAFING
jgi:hypothetical protein